jgi:uncharacterized membrane protein YoaK (UPF0700 family)
MTAPQPGWARRYTADPAHGPLPLLLLLLTLVTGLVDAVSILALGRVFVANMTGNIVFLGFAVVGAPGFSLAASLFALAGFLVGAAGGGGLSTRVAHRGRLLTACAAGEFVLFGVGALLLAIVSSHNAATHNAVAALLAIAMGAQNAVVRKLAVPDLTTTVLTMTLTGIAADARKSGPAVVVRRLLAVAVMFGGAAVGALIVLHSDPGIAVAVACAVAFAVAVSAALASRAAAPWHQLRS